MECLTICVYWWAARLLVLLMLCPYSPFPATQSRHILYENKVIPENKSYIHVSFRCKEYWVLIMTVHPRCIFPPKCLSISRFRYTWVKPACLVGNEKVILSIEVLQKKPCLPVIYSGVNLGHPQQEGNESNCLPSLCLYFCSLGSTVILGHFYFQNNQRQKHRHSCFLTARRTPTAYTEVTT